MLGPYIKSTGIKGTEMSVNAAFITMETYVQQGETFDFFIECFTTTFLHAHSWLNWVDEDDDEDEVGLKEKPEDKKITSK